MAEMKVGSSTVLFLLNAAGVNQMRAQLPGLTDIELATTLMARKGSRHKGVKSSVDLSI
jgi:hypothetical protein